VFAIQLGEVREHGHTRNVLDKVLAAPQVAALGIVLSPCVRGIASDAEWIVLGAPGIAKSAGGTVIVRGRWRRGEVASCLAASSEVHVAADGAKVFRVGATGWIDFLDEHTAYIALDAKL